MMYKNPITPELYMRIVELAIPIYEDRLKDIPFYADRGENFWHNFIGSRIMEAKYLVEEKHGKL